MYHREDNLLWGWITICITVLILKALGMLPISWAVATAPVWAPYVALGALFTAAVIKEMVEKRKTAESTGSQSVIDPSDDLCHENIISQVDTERKTKDAAGESEIFRKEC
jgi:hypothetical protein